MGTESLDLTDEELGTRMVIAETAVETILELCKVAIKNPPTILDVVSVAAYTYLSAILHGLPTPFKEFHKELTEPVIHSTTLDVDGVTVYISVSTEPPKQTEVQTNTTTFSTRLH